MKKSENFQKETINMEGANFEQKVCPEAIEKTLKRHIVDIQPHGEGGKELLEKLSSAAVGVARVDAPRPDPPLSIDLCVLRRGKSKVLIGPNGAGKSTFFDAVMERDAFFDTRLGRGALTYGKPVHGREELRIARLDQEELLGNINDFSAEEVLRSAALYFKSQLPVDWDDQDRYEDNIKNEDARQRIEILMDQITKMFDMQGFLERKVSELSGGERTKLSLFMVLLSEPDVLLLDEPTNHLDLKSITQLTALFEKYKRGGISLVSVSHVDWFLKDTGRDGTIEIVWKQGKRYLIDSSSAYEQYLKNRSRESEPIIQGEIPWLQRGYYNFKEGSVVVQAPPRDFSVPDSPLREISMPTTVGGELILLLGDNGSGKSKLMEVLVNNNRPELPRKQKGVQVAHLPQFWPEEVTDGTLGDFLDWVKEESAPLSKGSARYVDQPPKNLFIELLRDLKFGGASKIGEGVLKRPLKKFSGGEQRALWFIAVASLRNIDMLVLDEPTNHMDKNLQEVVAKAIESFPGAVVISTHDKELILKLNSNKVRNSKPKNLLLEKDGGWTSIDYCGDPAKYLEEVIRGANQKAKQLKI